MQDGTKIILQVLAIVVAIVGIFAGVFRRRIRRIFNRLQFTSFNPNRCLVTCTIGSVSAIRVLLAVENKTQLPAIGCKLLINDFRLTFRNGEYQSSQENSIPLPWEHVDEPLTVDINPRTTQVFEIGLYVPSIRHNSSQDVSSEFRIRYLQGDPFRWNPNEVVTLTGRLVVNSATHRAISRSFSLRFPFPVPSQGGKDVYKPKETL